MKAVGRSSPLFVGGQKEDGCSGEMEAALYTQSPSHSGM